MRMASRQAFCHRRRFTPLQQAAMPAPVFMACQSMPCYRQRVLPGRRRRANPAAPQSSHKQEAGSAKEGRKPLACVHVRAIFCGASARAKTRFLTDHATSRPAGCMGRNRPRSGVYSVAYAAALTHQRLDLAALRA